MTEQLPAAPPAVRLADISKRFGLLLACDRVTLEVQTGSIHAIVGENGAGKTTLMRILAGLERPDQGEIWLEGQRILRHDAGSAIRHGLGMVHQHFMLVEPLTVAENLVLGQEPVRRGLVDRVAAARAVTELGEQYGLPLAPEALIRDLSVGQRQKVEILKVLYRGARILVLDEPTAVLTPVEVRGLFAMLRTLQEQGRTVILITHKLEEVMAVADRVTVLRRGGKVADLEVAATDPQALAHLMVGRAVRLAEADVATTAQAPARADTTATTPVLELQEVTLRQGGATRLDRISLQLRAGEILGVAGVQGNGQTELLEVIAGLQRCTSGRLLLEGRDLTRTDAQARLGAGLAHIAEDRQRQGLVLEFTVAENLILGRQRQYRTGWWLDRPRIAARARELIAGFDIRPPSPAARARELSGGNQQKIVVAREVAGTGRPRLLLAGHPTRGVDVGAVEEIHRRLREARAQGTAILLVSADLAELLALSDRIAVLYHGRLVAERPAATTSTEELGELMLGAVPGELAPRPSTNQPAPDGGAP